VRAAKAGAADTAGPDCIEAVETAEVVLSGPAFDTDLLPFPSLSFGDAGIGTVFHKVCSHTVVRALLERALAKLRAKEEL